ncbi:actin interacting protein 3-domain-containing protein [Boletus edulis BED1]|uniref:Actin interacting protein 3-domain-containing protein n=1 Tax=Boletus edulis BED1 TaxID=1328754 RepID=A0AAD4C5J8_BOLED|nr:actin interacting protein 3-domain-containing protein [Boletus edulis BED1]
MASPSIPQQPPSSDAHKSRRDNQSVSSTHSTASSSRSARAAHVSSVVRPFFPVLSLLVQPAVESAVTRLLVAIKQLLESLTMWSNLQVTEAQISDVYVRLGNDFNAAVAAFASFDIDMRDLMSIPEDLRDVLETCLAEDATPDNLAIYLPKVRAIITRLLQGLRTKQSMYRRIVSDQHPSHQRSGSSHARTTSRSSKLDKTVRPDSEVKQHRSQLSRSHADEERHVERDRESAHAARQANRAASHSSRQSESRIQVQPQPRMTPPPVFQEPDDDPPANDRTLTSHLNGHASQVSQPPSRNPQPVHALSYAPQEQHAPAEPGAPIPSNPRASNPPTPETDKEVPPVPPAQSALVPASVKRYSLVDKPVSSPPRSPPTVIIEEPSPDRNDTNGVDTSPPQTPPIEPSDVPAVASSLAALKKSEALERRASKRFSTYHFSKMTGGAITRERTLTVSPNNRRSMAASSTSTLSAGDLAVLTETDEPEGKRDGTSKRTLRTPSPAGVEVAPPVPPLPPSVSDAARPPVPPLPPSYLSKLSEEIEPEEGFLPTAFPVFLQVGREVKKVTLEPGLTFAFLRMLFVDRFSYNPGMENFPAIYIRDPSSGVQYELEDIDEVKEKCLLSLNIEPLDQIKQHIDAQISVLSNDLKELKSTMVNNRRASLPFNPIVAHDFVQSTPVADRPSEKQFAHVAHRLSRIVGDAHNHSNPFIFPQMTGQSLQLQPQTTGASIMSEYSGRVVNDLKTQFDEVQNLRRDLGIMRQLYTEFMKSTKESLGALRTQTQSVKQLASSKVGGARAYINTGKTKLDTRSQNVLTKIEELQDTVEALKDDVTKRHMTPKPAVLKAIQEDVASSSTELASLKEHIDTIKPMWKKTWEEELQNIVEEQGFLGHQEELLGDLLEDHKALTEVLGHVQKVISLRGGGASGRGSGRGRSYKPLLAEEGHGGLSTVMMEIRGAAVDPEKRMKAIAANQKNREKELASRSDEFQNELEGFVNGKRLKMTGGAEEVERVRQKRNDLALKAMFNSASGTGVGGEVTAVSPTV